MQVRSGYPVHDTVHIHVQFVSDHTRKTLARDLNTFTEIQSASERSKHLQINLIAPTPTRTPDPTATSSRDSAKTRVRNPQDSVIPPQKT